jgi:signal transduction protein with GAF and PtsI domain
MTTPLSEKDEDEAIEKEVSVILGEVETIINDPSESVERKKEAQSMIQRAIEKGSTSGGTGKIREEVRKRYEYITKMYYNAQIQDLEIIKETLKRQIEQEQESSSSSSSLQRLEELKRDLEECERTMESHRKFLENLQEE